MEHRSAALKLLRKFNPRADGGVECRRKSGGTVVD
jgi:hypothetical protein